MIQSILTTPIQLASNSSTIVFPIDTDRSRSANCCGWLQHTENSPLYKIIEGGYYDINFSGTLASAVAGVIGIGLYVDGVLLPETISAATVGAGELTNISFNKKLKVCCRGDATITVASVPSILTAATTTPVETEVPTIEYANFSIEKEH